MLAFLFLGVKTLEGLLLGAFLSALAALSLILLARHYTKLPFDGVLASILSSFFGAGLVLSSIIQHTGNANQSGLNQFIFGQASTILYRDVLLTGSISIFTLFLIFLFRKELKLMAFDPDYAAVLGFPRATECIPLLPCHNHRPSFHPGRRHYPHERHAHRACRCRKAVDAAS